MTIFLFEEDIASSYETPLFYELVQLFGCQSKISLDISPPEEALGMRCHEKWVTANPEGGIASIACPLPLAMPGCGCRAVTTGVAKTRIESVGLLEKPLVKLHLSHCARDEYFRERQDPLTGLLTLLG